MRFSSLYRISSYLTLFLATLTLSIDAGMDFPLAPLYPLAVAAVAIVAFWTVDRDPRLGLPRGLAQGLALGSILLSLFEYWYDPNLLILAMGHWLVYLQLIKMLLPKTVEDDWFLYLLALTQVVVGAFLPGERVGFVLILWALVSMWTLTLFYLHRGAGPLAQPEPGATVRPAPDPGEPYPGLIDGPFVLSGLTVVLLTLALGGMIFLLMPRRQTIAQPRGDMTGLSQHLTGFSDTVELGRMGEILESEEVVMSIELFDAQNNRVAPSGEPLWRGVVMMDYQRGRWNRQRADRSNFDGDTALPPLPRRPVKQVIRLEPTASEVLFALRPIVRADGRRLEFNPFDGTIYRSDLRRSSIYGGRRARPGPYDYEVISDLDAPLIQPGEFYPGSRQLSRDPQGEFHGSLLEVPLDLLPVLQAIVEEVLADIPADDVIGRARALESYLRDSGQFSYTLRMTRIDATIDPVADFLLNRKSGHCEYFGSALTLLLRAAGIPARMINGFKGGDWNDLGQVLVVRQKHAHSWVEALTGRSTNTLGGEGQWLTLDPTPAEERAESLAQLGGLSRHLRVLSDYFRYLWIFYVVGFNEERQYELIYGPLVQLFEEARTGFRIMGEALSDSVGRLLHFTSLRSFFSVRGFFVSVFALLLLAGAVRLARSVWNRIVLRSRSAGDSAAEAVSGVATYRRLVRVLGELGLQRPPPETPREFARRASEVLSTRVPEAEGLADVPPGVVDAFYGVRFGERSLSPEELRSLEDRLDALEQSLRPQ